jgi:MFS superfamily sulfate permease-like transporter
VHANEPGDRTRLADSVTIPQISESLRVVEPGIWGADWAWGLPLIVLTVVVHVLGLGLLNLQAVRIFSGTQRRHPTVVFVSVMGTMTLLATFLHAVEASIWAVCYQFVGAIPSFRYAMLYSLGAMTTYGNSPVSLDDPWKLMGDIEALSGGLLFSLTAAFLFGMIQKVWGRADHKI